MKLNAKLGFRLILFTYVSIKSVLLYNQIYFLRENPSKIMNENIFFLFKYRIKPFKIPAFFIQTDELYLKNTYGTLCASYFF